MTKSELIKKIHTNSDYNYAYIEQITDLVFELISQGLVEEDKVVISGFGTFEKYYQDGYAGVNPATGQPIKVAGKYKIRFNASKKLKETLK